jgi:phosphohistidine phosphatase
MILFLRTNPNFRIFWEKTMTKRLMLLRHAKSSWKDKHLKDFDRPLKKKGEETAELIGKILAHDGYLPDLILSSPAKRASQTTEIVNEYSGLKGSTQFVEAFYMAEPGEYIQALRELPDSVNSVMVVGHNPGLEALLQMLEGKVNALSTGALAILELELTHWSDLNSSTVGKLSKFWDPDEMDLKEIEEKMAKDKKEKEEKVKEEKVKEKKDKKEKKGKKEKKEKKDKK